MHNTMWNKDYRNIPKGTYTIGKILHSTGILYCNKSIIMKFKMYAFWFP